ncbi:Arginine repressor C-terminal-like domain-containing protein [Artemisia annua]|uniref:DNA topoisomerase (ATP-hydrolyzing) n=1 Tax=Artemisia annua TaxID=35608 RepID=A0A2U1QCW7_ARTAN|nr:Arginine repressor C-terminal-like domain-containing protein [Artemisia annua]
MATPQNDPPIERCEWIWDWEEKKMRKRSIKFVPSLYKIYEKVVVKAADKQKVKEIKVSIDVKNAIISVWNNGQRVDAHKKDEYWTKQAIRYSSQFTIETAHGFKRSKKVFANHSVHTTDSDLESSENWSKVSFEPNLEKFGMRLLEDDTVALMRRRVVDLAGCLGNSVNVELDGAFFQFRTFEEYVQLYPQDTGRVYEKVTDRCEVCICIADEEFDQVSFVNNFATLKGGSHVDYITSQVTGFLAKKLIHLKPDEIKSHLWVFVNALIDNPAFDSQNKENLTTDKDSFGSTCKLTHEFLKKVVNSDVLDRLLSYADDRRIEKLEKRKGKLNIPGLEEAYLAGTAESGDCTLILAVGDSAKAFAMSGLSYLGQDKYGMFPLEDNLLNLRRATNTELLQNAEIQNIKNILGLQDGKSYVNKELRYGRLMIMADQDPDGSLIKGLLIMIFYRLWPFLLRKNFMCIFKTPIVKASYKNNNMVLFHTMPEYLEWKRQLGKEATKYKIKYYKGLETIESKGVKYCYANLDQHIEDLYWVDDKDDYAIDLAFSTMKIKERNDWLRAPEDYFDPKEKHIRKFINTEFKQYVLADLQRSIPSMVDGLKPGQRKILFSAFKKPITQEIEVGQFSVYVYQHSAYHHHHGEASLFSTIIGMAQNFVGSNNVNLLQPIGQFGTRLMGGKDHASGSPIFTQLSPITRYLFQKDDELILDYLNDDGQSIEPKCVKKDPGYTTEGKISMDTTDGFRITELPVKKWTWDIRGIFGCSSWEGHREGKLKIYDTPEQNSSASRAKERCVGMENKIEFIRQASWRENFCSLERRFHDRCALLKGKETKEEVNLEDEVAAGGYNYLVDVAFNAFLPEDLEMLENEIGEKKREFEELTTRTASEIWLKELNDLDIQLAGEGYRLSSPKIAEDTEASFQNCPILLKVGHQNFGPKPFKVFDKWIGDAGFLEVITNAWASNFGYATPDLMLKNKLKSLRLAIKSWTSSQITAQKQAKEDLVRSLIDWDIKAEAGQVNYIDVEKREEWLMDLNYLDQLHRDDLKQKSRLKWAVEGDENTRFFHSIIKHKSNLLFGTVMDQRPRGRTAFNFKFIKSYWEIIKYDFLNCVKYFETTGKFANGCKPSFIVLIPKKADPLGFSDYRPISLIGCVYKVISKILSARLAKVIPSIIGPNQTAFIEGRQNLDGCLVANEIIRMANIEDLNLMIFKVDFEKAFDSVNWNFLHDIMKQMGFGEKWRKWIDACLSSASNSVMVNGSPSKEFKMERGLRQGDPLSPFLFLIVAEALQVAVLEACSKGVFKGITLADGGANLSLLQYADDALFIGEWSRLNVKNLILILKCFENASGLKVNLSKSRLFGIVIPNIEVEEVASSLGCIHDSLPFMYLGLPVGKKMRLCDGWNDVINRFRERLSAWKAKALSIGGRLTLVKSILGSLPIYYLSLFKAPKKVINLLESIRCRFFWGFKENQRGISWVKWNSILLKPSMGGLGVGSLLAKNLSLLGKWKWRFLTEKEALWRMVIQKFYGDSGGFGSLTDFPGPNGIWCDIIKAMEDIEIIDPTFKQSFHIKVSNGANVSFWKDTWCENGIRLMDLFPRLYALDSFQDCKLIDRWHLVDGSCAFDPNPKFGSKTKETLTTDDGNFTLNCVLTKSFLKKTANILLKKKAGELKINKLVDARLSDTVYASLCTLILTEGDSGQVFAESGLSALGRHKHGLVPIRGKLVNVKKATPKKLLKNSEFQNIKKIIGLKERESYENVKELRYGRVMIMADQDHDGSHIKGLLISAFHQLWPSLLSIDNFLCVASIPICVAFHKRSEEIVWFYTQAMYEKWEEKARLEEYTTQRYKGLGHIDKNVGKKLFAELYQQQVKFFYRENEEDDRIIQAAFGKDVEARKRWLQEPQDHIADWDQTVKRYRFRDFFIKEIKHHAAANLLRSIPSMVDGFKPVNRKIMFAGAIIGMAQSYVGSNNINLLQPMGQFGSREKGGKDKVKDRYMSTRLSRITRYLFRKADEVLLNYMAGDHQSIEPEWYMPVIPLILVNGCDGVSFGRRSFVPKYDPRKIIENIKRLLRDEALVPLDPWYRDFAGEIEQTPSKNTEYTIKGVVKTKPRNTILIADLPLNKLPEKYISYLEKIKGIDIEGYKEDRGEDNVQFTLYLSKDQMADAKKEGLLNKFKLTTKVSTKNMYLFDAEGILKKYDTPEQILEEFFHLRLDFYERRKTALLRELKKGVLVLENKIGYIRQSSAGQILFFGMSFYDRCVLLKGKGFKSSTSIEREAEQLGWVETKEEVNLEEEVTAGGYNYLMDVAVGRVMPDDLEMLENEKNEKKREYEKLTTRNARELWLEDLDDLKRALITEYGYTK